MKKNILRSTSYKTSQSLNSIHIKIKISHLLLQALKHENFNFNLYWGFDRLNFNDKWGK